METSYIDCTVFSHKTPLCKNYKAQKTVKIKNFQRIMYSVIQDFFVVSFKKKTFYPCCYFYQEKIHFKTFFCVNPFYGGAFLPETIITVLFCYLQIA